MDPYRDGFNTGYGGPPNNLSESDRIDWRRGQDDASRARDEAQKLSDSERNTPTRTSKPGGFDAAIVLGLGAYILSYFHLLQIVLCALLVLGLIGWLLVKKKGKWVAYGLLVVSLLTGLYVFSSWVERKIEYRAIQTEQKQREEEYARQAIKMQRADSILRVNRAKYPSLRAIRAKQRALKKAAKPHHSSRPTLAEALGIGVE